MVVKSFSGSNANHYLGQIVDHLYPKEHIVVCPYHG